MDVDCGGTNVATSTANTVFAGPASGAAAAPAFRALVDDDIPNDITITEADMVVKNLYDAYTILAATADNTPAALTVTEQTVVGRATGGAIAALAIDSDLSAVSANDDTVPSAKATKAYAETRMAATSAAVVATFASGSCSGYLKSDGGCDTPAGGATISEGNSSVDVDDGAGGAGSVDVTVDGSVVTATTASGVAVTGGLSVTGAITQDPSSDPIDQGNDSDADATGTFKIYANALTAGQDSQVIVQVDDSAGEQQTQAVFDGLKETSTFHRVLANIPQAKTYDDNDDDDETVGVDLLSSIIFITGDNDSDNDSIDLQDGTVDGQMITFIAAANVDADDTFTIDAETDSTCTGCPNSGILVLDTVGDSVSIVWSGSKTTTPAWFYLGAYAQ